MTNLKNVLCGIVVIFTGASAWAQVPQLLNYQGRIAVNGTNFSGSGQFKFALVDGGTNLTRTAAGTASVINGFLIAVNVTDGGAGYTTPPTVLITGGGGSGASLTAQISAGVVTSVAVISAGSGYSSLPAISFSAPPSIGVVRTFWSNDGTSSGGGQPTTSVPVLVTKGLYSVLLGDTTLSNMTAVPAVVFTNTDVRLRVWFSDGINNFQQLAPDQRLAAVGYAIMAGTVADGSITASKIAPGAVGSSQLAPNLTIPGTLTASNLVINGTAWSNSSPSFQLPSGTNIQTYAGGYYFITNAPANIILPPTANVGDTLHLRIPNNYGYFTYNIQQNAGQRIVTWSGISGIAGSVACSADATRLAVNADSGTSFLLSTNSAASWAIQPPPGPGPAYRFGSTVISRDGSRVYVLAYLQNRPGVLLSQDNGNSWILSTNLLSLGVSPPPNSDPFTAPFASLACSSNGTKVVAFSNYKANDNSDVGGIYTSIDGGLNWTLQTGAPTNTIWGAVASSADGTKLTAATGWHWGGTTSTNDGIYTSTDSGVAWTRQIGGNWLALASSADGTQLVACTSFSSIPRIYTSTDSGTTWTLQPGAPMTNASIVLASSAAGNKLAAAVSGRGIYTSADSGISWTLQTNGLPLYTTCTSVASSADGTKLVGVFFDGLYTSTMSASSWTRCTSLPTFPIQTMTAISSLGTSGGATFSSLSNNELILVYLGNGLFAVGDSNLNDSNLDCNLFGY